MKTFIKSSLNVLKLIFIASILAGCIDEPVAPQNYLINGRVVGGYVRYLSIGDYPIIPSDYNGNFQIESPSKPFDLYLSERYYDLSHKFVGITENNIKLVFEDDDYNIYFETQPCFITVRFPTLSESKYVALKFISSEKFFQDHKELVIDPSSNTQSFVVRIPVNAFSISGKLIYLEASVNDYGDIISYDKYGSKDVTLIHGTYDQVVEYDDNEISFNPPEMFTYVDIERNGLSIHTNDFYLTLPGMDRSCDIELLHNRDSYFSSILTPILPDTNFRIKLRNRMTNYSYEFCAEKEIIVRQGTYTYLQYPKTIMILYPENNVQNITDTSSFVISDNSGPAIYEYMFYNGQQTICYKTTARVIKFSDLKFLGFELLRNKEYKWSIRKIPGYVSMDDFVKEFYTVSRKYDYIELGELRSFKTAP